MREIMSKFNNIEFGNRLRAARIRNEFSQEYVGKKINKNACTIGKYEQGKLTPSVKVVSELCDILNIIVWIYIMKNRIM